MSTRPSYGSLTSNQTTQAVINNPVTDTTDSLSSIASSLHGLGVWAGDPLRLVKLVLGVVLIGVALLLLLTPGQTLAAKAANVGKLKSVAELTAL